MVYFCLFVFEVVILWKLLDIEFLGLPSLVSSGKVNYEGEDLRYLIIPKYNDSVESALERSKTCFTLLQVISIVRSVLHAYQYLHAEVRILIFKIYNWFKLLIKKTFWIFYFCKNYRITIYFSFNFFSELCSCWCKSSKFINGKKKWFWSCLSYWFWFI